jgi:hypothetical protein
MPRLRGIKVVPAEAQRRVLEPDAARERASIHGSDWRFGRFALCAKGLLPDVCTRRVHGLEGAGSVAGQGPSAKTPPWTRGLRPRCCAVISQEHLPQPTVPWSSVTEVGRPLPVECERIDLTAVRYGGDDPLCPPDAPCPQHDPSSVTVNGDGLPWRRRGALRESLMACCIESLAVCRITSGECRG